MSSNEQNKPKFTFKYKVDSDMLARAVDILKKGFKEQLLPRPTGIEPPFKTTYERRARVEFPLDFFKDFWDENLKVTESVTYQEAKVWETKYFERHKCVCDLQGLMAEGCKCGGI